ncbi:DNA polymerase III subunit delta [Thermaerobacter sp. PB12/4term]|uniref:DNA polymerase III subunit delta n=1 Tax=Thermaerobacter sp. PB12/4term TaxID=2293838 RepID=UPI000E3279A3|nr:DNA polymerase III subunit delta [Thermaerobacter sp. PB12/4term]QIA27957.1 DNA polymerase III subunit delta [Thermaerobacter sp. PB12/4term]
MESQPAATVLAAIEQGQIQPVYVLHGPETYWHDAIIQALRRTLLPDGDVLNLTQLDGRSAAPAQAVEQARTVPFLAERRLVVVREAAWLAPRGAAASSGRGTGGSAQGGGGRSTGGDAGGHAGGAGSQGGADQPEAGGAGSGSSAGTGRSTDPAEGALLAYLDDPSPSAVLVISHPPELDGRRAAVRRLRQRGWAVACQPLRDEALGQWLARQAAAWGKELDPEAVAWLVESGEPDLRRLASELAKVATYVGDRRRITAADLRQVGVAVATAGVFELVDAIVAGRRRQAMELVGRLLDASEPPLRLLALIARQYRILAYAASLRRQGGDVADLQAWLQLHPFVARKAWQQSRRLAPDRAMAALEAVLEADVGIKQGRWPARIGLERLVWFLAGLQAAEPATTKAPQPSAKKEAASRQKRP